MVHARRELFRLQPSCIGSLPATGRCGDHMGRGLGRSKQLKLQAIALGGALAAAAFAGTPAKAGFFDFLFGGPDKGPNPSVSSYANPSASPPPLGDESVRNSAGSTGHGVAYCVRLCDGQHFPLEA